MTQNTGEKIMINLDANGYEDAVHVHFSCSVDDEVEMKMLLVNEEDEDESCYRLFFSIRFDGFRQDEAKV